MSKPLRYENVIFNAIIFVDIFFLFPKRILYVELFVGGANI